MWLKERLNPRTPTNEPTPIDTASSANKNLELEARDSRQAMRNAVRQGKERLLIADNYSIAKFQATIGVAGQFAVVRNHHQSSALLAIELN